MTIYHHHYFVVGTFTVFRSIKLGTRRRIVAGCRHGATSIPEGAETAARNPQPVGDTNAAIQSCV